MINQLDQFINNLKYNEEVKIHINCFDILESNKDILIGKDFKKYIEFLKELEKKSH